MTPFQYWTIYGRNDFPMLQKIALRIFNVPISNASSERAWSTFDFIHTKKRNRLLNEKVKKLVFIYTNSALLDSDDPIDYLVAPINSDSDWINSFAYLFFRALVKKNVRYWYVPVHVLVRTGTHQYRKYRYQYNANTSNKYLLGVEQIFEQRNSLCVSWKFFARNNARWAIVLLVCFLSLVCPSLISLTYSLTRFAQYTY